MSEDPNLNIIFIWPYGGPMGEGGGLQNNNNHTNSTFHPEIPKPSPLGDPPSTSITTNTLWCFFVLFALELIVYLYFTLRTMWKVKESRNIFNFLIAIGFTLFMANRVTCIIIDLQTNIHFSFMLIYLFFQLPQDLLEIALLAFLFSMSEVFLTLEHLRHIAASQLTLSKATLRSEIIGASQSQHSEAGAQRPKALGLAPHYKISSQLIRNSMAQLSVRGSLPTDRESEVREVFVSAEHQNFNQKANNSSVEKPVEQPAFKPVGKRYNPNYQDIEEEVMTTEELEESETEL